MRERCDSKAFEQARGERHGRSIAWLGTAALYTPGVRLVRLGPGWLALASLTLALPTLALLMLALLVQPVAFAQVQGCDDDATEVQGDFEVTPLDRAEHVARNAPIVVRFADDVDLGELQASLQGELDAEPMVPCAGQLVCVLQNGDGDEAPRVIDAVVSIDGQVVRLEPVEPLAAEAEHTVLVVQPGLDRVGRKERTFTTSSRIDRERPVLDYGADDVQVTVVELPPECEQPEGSRRVVLELPAATDDGDAESVELEVTLTSANGLDDPEVRARARNEGDMVLVSFVLGAEETKSRICLSVRAVDALGRASQRQPRVCFNPSTRPIFESACAISTGAHDNNGGAWAWSAVLLAAWARSWRRCRRALDVPGKGL